MTSHTACYDAQELHRQRLEGLRLAAISDNLNNVLTVISAHATLLGATIPPGDPHEENVAGINDAVRCAAALSRRLLLITEGA